MTSLVFQDPPSKILFAIENQCHIKSRSSFLSIKYLIQQETLIFSRLIIAHVIVEELSHLSQCHITSVNVIFAIDVGHAHKVFDAFVAVMQFACTNGFFSNGVTGIPHCNATAPIHPSQFSIIVFAIK